MTENYLATQSNTPTGRSTGAGNRSGTRSRQARTTSQSLRLQFIAFRTVPALFPLRTAGRLCSPLFRCYLCDRIFTLTRVTRSSNATSKERDGGLRLIEADDLFIDARCAIVLARCRCRPQFFDDLQQTIPLQFQGLDGVPDLRILVDVDLDYHLIAWRPRTAAGRRSCDCRILSRV
jgi:hypothetical protein